MTSHHVRALTHTVKKKARTALGWGVHVCMDLVGSRLLGESRETQSERNRRRVITDILS